MPRTRWTRTDLLDADIEWLVDLAIGGGIVRVATTELNVTSDAGTLHYTAGILTTPMQKRSVSLFDLNPEAERILLDLLVPLDVPGLAAQGHRLAYSPVAISQVRVRNGVVLDAYESRVVILTGRVAQARYGVRGYGESRAPQTTIFVTAERALEESGAVIPLDHQAVDADTWSVDANNLSQADLGVAYPLTFGFPGRDDLSPQGFVPGALLVWARKSTDFHLGIVALGTVEASTVILSTAEDVYGKPVTLRTIYTSGGTTIPARDARGTLVSCIDYAGDGYDVSGGSYLGASYSPAQEDNTAVYVSWVSGGGMSKPGGGVLRGAGDVLRFMLERSSIPVDHGRLAAVGAYLNLWQIDAVVEAQTSPLTWLTTHLLPIIPVTLITTEAGIAPIVWRHDASAADAVLHIDLDADPSLEAGDTVSEEEGEDLVNSYVLRFAHNRRTGTYAHTVRLGPDAIESTARAVGQLVADNGASADRRMNIRAVAAGQAGVGIRVTLTITAGAESYTEDVATKAVAINLLSGTSKTEDLYALIMSGTLLTASYPSADYGFNWLTTSTPTVTTVIGDFGTAQDAMCTRSRDMLARIDAPGPNAGIRRSEMETRIVYDLGTAIRTNVWRAAAYAMPDRRIELMGPAATLADADLGSYVLVSSTAHGLTRQLGIVEGIESDGRVTAMRIVFKEAQRTAATA